MSHSELHFVLGFMCGKYEVKIIYFTWLECTIRLASVWEVFLLKYWCSISSDFKVDLADFFFVFCGIHTRHWPCEHSKKEVLCLSLPISMEEPLYRPNPHQQHPIHFRHCESPLHTVHIVEELIRQWRAGLLRWDSLMHHCDHHRCQHQVERCVYERNHRLPPLHGWRLALAVRYRDLHVISMSAQALEYGTVLYFLCCGAVNRALRVDVLVGTCGVALALVVCQSHESSHTLPTNYAHAVIHQAWLLFWDPPRLLLQMKGFLVRGFRCGAPAVMKEIGRKSDPIIL